MSILGDARSKRLSGLACGLALTLCAGSAAARPQGQPTPGCGTIVQSGSLSGGGPAMTQPVDVAAFDDQGGARSLDSVQVDVLTSTIGGCTSNATGIPTQVHARLVADFSLGLQPLVDTEALIDAQVSNVGPPTALTFFDTDSGAILLNTAADLAPWIGAGQVTLDAFTEFEVWEIPANSVSFSAGGSIQWTVTYAYSSTGSTTQSYCVASPNSAGPGATISASGSTSISSQNFVLNVAGAVPGTLGIFFYGPDQAQTPFGEGLLCLGGGSLGVFRLSPAVQADAAGQASLAVDFSSPPAGSGPGTLSDGSTWNFQFWFRDPAGGPSGFNTSDALAATFCP